MKKLALTLCSGLFALGVVFGMDVDRAEAIKPFQDEFLKLYVKADSAVPAEKALATAVETAKCNVCHDPNSKSKKDRNPYGQALAELLDKKEHKDKPEEIQAALIKVEGMKLKPTDAASPSFGELIKQGKLPGAE